MGGGGDSRIPGCLQSLLDPQKYQVVIRTYDFDPPIGRSQIEAWVRELGIPHLFVSPALGAPAQLVKFAPLARFALGRWYLHHHYPVKEGDRQPLKFRYDVMMRYREHEAAALAAIGPDEYYYAFFGTQDHFMRSGVVQVSLWEKYFGNTYTMYEGTHFMEEEYLKSLLVPKILEVLSFANAAGNV